MEQQPGRYVAYLLRLWQVRSQGQWVWRASLERPADGKREVFPDVRQLLGFLQSLTASELLEAPASSERQPVAGEGGSNIDMRSFTQYDQDH